MKERLVQLLDLEQLTPSKFADIIGVQRSSVSHVISGRNKPSFDFLQKTLRAFPGLHADWLILGDGSMYEQMGRDVSGNLFDLPSPPTEALFPDDIQDEEQVSVQNMETESAFQDTDIQKSDDLLPDSEDVASINNISKGEADQKIVRVMIFYDDDTFRSFGPSQ